MQSLLGPTSTPLSKQAFTHNIDRANMFYISPQERKISDPIFLSCSHVPVQNVPSRVLKMPGTWERGNMRTRERGNVKPGNRAHLCVLEPQLQIFTALCYL